MLDIVNGIVTNLLQVKIFEFSKMKQDEVNGDG
jgi:hypothetical protein